VLGGPLLCFQDNNFLNGNSLVDGTKAIYNRVKKGIMQWEEDLSGPFAILLINKNTSEIHCTTDLMSFIPVYSFHDSSNIILSSHVDLVARVSGQQENIDVVSEVDFILHGKVTYPYTCYNNIIQIAPASNHFIKSNNNQLLSTNYWLPIEKYQYKSINQAAYKLRDALQTYVNSIAGNISNVAHFISGGEDSRAIAGLLSKEYDRDAYVFLDHINREGKVARRAANAYGSDFNLGTRSKLHYLEILPSCADLVGKGSQYIHAHTLGFHKSCKLNEYSAVFGGLFSDALLKGARIKKLGIIPLMPQIKRSDYSAATPIKNDAINSKVLDELTQRRKAHLNYIMSFRKESAEEWFELWPSSMNVNIPNLHVNRRLFRSYEPFMSMEVVKISATVPQRWKLNRRLFNKAVRPLLKPTKWLLHGDGRLPYFPWYINMFVQLPVRLLWKVGMKFGMIKGNQGPWGEWDTTMNSLEWGRTIENFSDGITGLSDALNEKDLKTLFTGSKLDYIQQINLVQTLYMNHNMKHQSNEYPFD